MQHKIQKQNGVIKQVPRNNDSFFWIHDSSPRSHQSR